MKYLSLLSLLIVSVLIVSCDDQSLSGTSTELAAIDTVFKAMDNDSVPGCSCSVMEKGEIVYEKGFGVANFEYDIMIEPNSIFHVASVSKHFTAMAIELLVSEGKVDWDDDIRDYVPEVPDFGHTITLRHLVHHTSGIRDQWNLLAAAGWRWEADVVTQKDVLEITSRQTALNFDPGERYMYSNTGFTLLAVVVERISGQTLKEFCQERIFGPLEMNDTHFHDDHETIVPNRAMGYRPNGDGYKGWQISIPDFDVVGATSLFTTVQDLAKWDKNFYTKEVGGEDVFDRYYDEFILNNGDTIDYLHGLSKGTYKGEPYVGHGGADAGYRSNFMRFPDRETTVAVLCNFPASNPGGLARQVADIVLHLEDPESESEEEAEEEEPEAGSVEMSREELEARVGTYYSQENEQAYILEMKEEDLMIKAGPGYVLSPLSATSMDIVGTGGATLDFSEGDSLYFKINNQGSKYHWNETWDASEDELMKYTGSFYSEELGTFYNFKLVDGKFEFHHRKLETEELQPIFEGYFDYNGSSIQFNGFDSFTYSDGRVQNVKFERVD